MAKKRRQKDIQCALPVTIYPFFRHDNYAITIDVSNLTADVTKPDAKLNFVIDKEIVHSIAIQDLIQGFFAR